MYQTLPLKSILGAPRPSQLEEGWKWKFPWCARVASSQLESIAVTSLVQKPCGSCLEE